MVQHVFMDVKSEGTGDDKGTCATCKSTEKLKTDKSGCLYGCKIQDSNACTACNDGYILTKAGTCIKGCDTVDTTADCAKCSKCTTEANLYW